MTTYDGTFYRRSVSLDSLRAVSELYSAPKIAVPDDGYGCSGYKVSEILYNEHREIIHLVIVNRFGKEVFRWDAQQQSQSVSTPALASETNKLVSAGDNLNKVIQSIKDNANKVYHLEGTNKEQLKRFVDFYIVKIEKEGWKGTFNFDTLFKRWMDRVKS